MQNSYRWKPLAILVQNITPESHDFSQSRKLNTKISILFFNLLFCSFFLSFSLSFPSSISQKVYSVYEPSKHQTNVLLSEIFLFLVTAACELRLISYGPNTCYGGFPVRHFVRNYMHNSKTNGWGSFTYRTIALKSEISTLSVRATCICEIRFASYESQHGMQPLSDIPFGAYLHT